MWPIPKNPGPGWSPMWSTGRPGPVTGHRPMTGFWFFVKISSVTMTDSETEDDGWEQGSRDEEQSEEGTDDVQEVETSGSRASD